MVMTADYVFFASQPVLTSPAQLRLQRLARRDLSVETLVNNISPAKGPLAAGNDRVYYVSSSEGVISLRFSGEGRRREGITGVRAFTASDDWFYWTDLEALRRKSALTGAVETIHVFESSDLKGMEIALGAYSAGTLTRLVMAKTERRATNDEYELIEFEFDHSVLDGTVKVNQRTIARGPGLASDVRVTERRAFWLATLGEGRSMTRGLYRAGASEEPVWLASADDVLSYTTNGTAVIASVTRGYKGLRAFDADAPTRVFEYRTLSDCTYPELDKDALWLFDHSQAALVRLPMASLFKR
jgi:hypothetical protein